MQDLKQQDHLVATLPQSCLGLEDHHEQIPHTPHKEGDVVIMGGEPAGSGENSPLVPRNGFCLSFLVSPIHISHQQVTGSRAKPPGAGVHHHGPSQVPWLSAPGSVLTLQGAGHHGGGDGGVVQVEAGP